MADTFPAKLELLLKAFSMTRSRLAAELEVDKSVIGRWLGGTVSPSAHNLSRLTELVANRVTGFAALDWDRRLADFATLLGVDPAALEEDEAKPPGLDLSVLGEVITTTALRGAAYEGFFRTTRPYALTPGRFLHDYGMIRRHADGLLRVQMGSGRALAEGYILLLHNQMFVIASAATPGGMTFGVFNGVATGRVDRVDGVGVGSSLDAGRTPTAFAMVVERIGDLTGDVEADDAHFGELTANDPMAPEGSISDSLRDHLLRDIGPQQLPLGGDLLLQMPLARSISAGGLPHRP